MRPDEYHNPTGRETRRGSRFELFFYEQVGARYYLRFTRLALLLVVCLTVIPMVAICALFFTESHADLENVNINIRSHSQAPGNDVRQIIQPPPPGADAHTAEGRQKSKRWRAGAADTCRTRPERQRAADPEPDAVNHAAEAARLSRGGASGMLLL
jgi:hypothetical protein